MLPLAVPSVAPLPPHRAPHTHLQNIGVVKTAVGRATDSTNQARAFGLISLYGGAGGIAGAGIGGLTARLAVKYPDTFSPDGLWGRFPYLAPNLISCAITAVAIVLAYFFVPKDSAEERASAQTIVVEVSDSSTKAANGDADELTISTPPLAPSESLTDSEDSIVSQLHSTQVMTDGDAISLPSAASASSFAASVGRVFALVVAVPADVWQKLTGTRYAHHAQHNTNTNTNNTTHTQHNSIQHQHNNTA